MFRRRWAEFCEIMHVVFSDAHGDGPCLEAFLDRIGGRHG